MTKTFETRISDFLSAYERLRDASVYPIKTPKDDIVCVICGGCYKRRDKQRHCKTKKHKLMLPLVMRGTVTPYIEWAQIDSSSEE